MSESKKLGASTAPYAGVVVGAGAAGSFAAIHLAELSGCPVLLLERARQPLSKVRISGGGRCNVTHACFDPARLVEHYPRGSRELLGPYHRFQPQDTVSWFAERGVSLKTEADGRMFPATDDSATIIECFLREMKRWRVDLRCGLGVKDIQAVSPHRWRLLLTDGNLIETENCLLAFGSTANNPLMESLERLGLDIVPSVPSLFTFRIADACLQDLAGLSVPSAKVSLGTSGSFQEGPVLITHWGLSGPAVLRFSAWLARELAACHYEFAISVNWTGLDPDRVRQRLDDMRLEFPRKQIGNTSAEWLPRRLWERLVQLEGLSSTIWSQLTAPRREKLVERLTAHTLQVRGKSTHKDEFVTCGGISLAEIRFPLMESRRFPGLYFAGECLNVDGITGGFNFQSAWTTGYLAAEAMAQNVSA